MDYQVLGHMFKEIGDRLTLMLLMTDIGNNLHEIIIDIDQYYGFPSGTNVAKIGICFRNADGSLEGKTASMGDIFYQFILLMVVFRQQL